MDEQKLNTPEDVMLTNAVNETVKENRFVTENKVDFLKKVHHKFIESKIRDFPNLCDETRRVNVLQQQAFQQAGNAGGWIGKRKDFKHEYVIPRELYVFMTNLIYRNFWDDANSKVWRSFMRAIMRGDEPMDLLRKVRMHYDTNINQAV